MVAFRLRIACALAALCAKEIMNVYTWTIGAVHTPAAFVVVAGGGLPFDVTDTIATLLFALAFRPGAGAAARPYARAHERHLGEREPRSGGSGADRRR